MKYFPCVCGHNFTEHKENSFKLVMLLCEFWCSACFLEDPASMNNFHTFVPDNLKYLGDLYEKR